MATIRLAVENGEADDAVEGFSCRDASGGEIGVRSRVGEVVEFREFDERIARRAAHNGTEPQVMLEGVDASSGDVTHRLVIHQRLFDYLVDQDVLGWTRYDLVLNLDARQRKHYSLK